MVELDKRIKQAQKKNAAVYVVLALLTLMILIGVFTWVFLINGYTLLVGPNDATNNYSTHSVSGSYYRYNDNVYVYGTDASFYVSSPTFEQVKVEINAQTPSNIEVILPPSPATLLAELDIPGDTNWFVDDLMVHVGNSLNYKLPHGSHKLRLENPYYQPFEQQLELQRGEKHYLTPNLSLVQGEISLDAVPEGATVELNEQQYPLPLTQAISGGKYQVKISKQGFKPIQDNIEISWQYPNQTRRYQLEPADAILQLSTKPSGGVLLVNGIQKSTNTITIPANTQINLQYSKPGYFTFNQSYRLTPGQQKEIDISLKEAIGKLNITSNVVAEVSIDGNVRGTTPLELSLPAVDYQIQLRKQGYRSISESVEVSANKTTNHRFNLITEYAARRAEGRPTAISQLGISMLRFRGEPYVMGSQPNTPGRRRNEHPVQVKLSKPFWVSTHEITEQQYGAFNGNKLSSQKPQTNVSWIDAVKFTNWLSQQEGLPPFYVIRGNQVVAVNSEASGYRLPTEAEWEWLASKAQRSVATIYVWGNASKIPQEAGNFADKSRKGQQPIILSDYDDKTADVANVGSFRPDRVGLYDLAGNVSEWVHDSYTNSIPDLNKVHENYLGASQGDLHVTKGGNFTTGQLRDLRAAYREPADAASNTIGFRIARYVLEDE
ncbi:SUMF1/EgtB/PvdO family nonheme iron enzyme [Glaciecola sp. 1036]|uniref:SUMF1/EgtB/PvdO family nonheme iron enzyme n=1 Tax=Alteromonadaceae TaxID=72275 RepID=UPI003D046A22